MSKLMQASLLLAMIGCTVVANLLMKMGQADRPNPLLLNVVSTRTLLGLVAFGCAAVLYTLILKVLPLWPSPSRRLSSSRSSAPPP